MQMPINIVIMAAGQGNRMCSKTPKVLHCLAGRPLLSYVYTAARAISEHVYIVYGHGADAVQAALLDSDIHWVHQEQQLGTAHAVQQVLPQLRDDERILVLNGDVPLVSVQTLTALIQNTAPDQLGLLVHTYADPTGLGRINRDSTGRVLGIVEDADCTPAQKRIQEAYTGVMVVSVTHLKRWLSQLSNQNSQGEFYLTDIVKCAALEQLAVTTVAVPNESEVQGVNTRAQLAQLERVVQLQQAHELMAMGVTLLDPARLDVRGTLNCAMEVTIDVNVIFEGEVSIDEGSVIGANCIIRNARIGKHVVVESNSVIDGVVIGDHCCVGPFARLRPGTQLDAHVKIGNFVETKKSHIGAHSKVSHLSYIGDAALGQRVNVGAGTITCNYDGVNKHQTVIEDDVFIGSNTQLVAPVTIGAHATIGAGTTVCADVPTQALAVSRTPQKNIPNWSKRSSVRREREKSSRSD
jgi:bifunctional UDP-N-acetylglucosamine pyrophosphorylase/glucosamine-1-phosphate N-acetyltransferase